MGADFFIHGDTRLDTKGFSTAVGKLGNIAKKGFGAIMAASTAAATALGGAGIASIKLASNLNEVQNVVDTTFGDNAQQINQWSKNAATAFGLSELQAKQFNGTMGAMLKSMGLTDDAVLDMSTSITGLAGDFASFYNLDTENAFEKIRSGISGETEPLKQLGINMSVANLEAYALSKGITKAYKDMSQAEQATLRYNYLMSVTADAQGDFAKTSDSLANQLRIASLQVQDLGGSIGATLLPMANEGLKALNGMLTELKEGFNNGGFDGLMDAFQQITVKALSSLANAAPHFVETGFYLIQSFTSAIIEVLPNLIDSGVQIVESILNGISDMLPTAGKETSNIITTITDAIFELLPNILTVGARILFVLVEGIIDSFPELIDGAISAVTTLIDTILNNLPQILETGSRMLVSLIDGIANKIPDILATIGEIILKIIVSIIDNLPEFLAAGGKIIGALLEGVLNLFGEIDVVFGRFVESVIKVITETDWLKVGGDILRGLADGILAALDGFMNWWNNVWDGMFGRKTINVDINTTETRTIKTVQEPASGGKNPRPSRNSRMIDGSHRAGLNHVPFDGYIAELHKGEMVLPKKQAELLRNFNAFEMSYETAAKMVHAAQNAILSNQIKGMSTVLQIPDLKQNNSSTPTTVQTEHTTIVQLDGRTVGKVVAPYIDTFLY